MIQLTLFSDFPYNIGDEVIIIEVHNSVMRKHVGVVERIKIAPSVAFDDLPEITKEYKECPLSVFVGDFWYIYRGGCPSYPADYMIWWTDKKNYAKTVMGIFDLLIDNRV